MGRSLLARVVVHGIAALGASAVGFVLVLALLIGTKMKRDTRAFSEWFAAEACRLVRDEAGGEGLRLLPPAVAVYDGAGEMIGSSDAYAGPPTFPEQLRLVPFGQPALVGSSLLIARDCGQGGQVAVVGGPEPPLPWFQLVCLIGLVIVVVGLGSVPLARSIVKPLRELSATAEALGRGALHTRAPVSRSDELGALGNALNTMAANLETHLRKEKELLANVSHELRTPLARVRVVLETALDDPSRAAALLKEISVDLGDLERMTDDVLAAIRLDFAGADESKGMTVRPTAIDFVELVKTAIARFAEANPNRDIGFEGPTAPAWVMGDRELLLRLFANLFDNARKYSTGDIRVSASLDGAGEKISVVIEDRGMGIDPDDLDRVFDPFFRSRRSRASSAGGQAWGSRCRNELLGLMEA